MQSHDTPTYHQMLKLGLSLGVLHIFCAPASAESLLTEPIDPKTEQETEQEIAQETAPETAQAIRRRASQVTGQSRQNQTSVTHNESLHKSLHTDEINQNLPSSHGSAIRSPTFSGAREQTTKQSSFQSLASLGPASLINEWSHKQPTHEQRLSNDSDQTDSALSAALSIEPLDISWQEVDLTSAENWFATLSSTLDGGSSENKASTAKLSTAKLSTVESIEPTPQLEHLPAFTQLAGAEAEAEEANALEAETSKLAEQSLTQSESVGTESVQTEFTDTEATETETTDTEANDTEATANLIAIDQITPDQIVPDIREVSAREFEDQPGDLEILLEALSENPITESTQDELRQETTQQDVLEQTAENAFRLQIDTQPSNTQTIETEIKSEQAIAQASPDVIGIVEDDTTSGTGQPSDTNRLGRDLLSEVLENHGVEPESYPVLDDELGTLRMVRLRSRENEELGILRILQTAQAAPPPPSAPIAYLGGRIGFVDVDNVFRTVDRIEDQVYQAGLSLYLAPKLSENTSLYAIAETNIARYNNISQVNYNELQVQLGVRQRLLPRTFAQIGWRNQRLYEPGYRDKIFDIHYIDALVSHRRILSPKSWVDGFYQARLGFGGPRTASRFRQTFTVSFNYGISQSLRTSLLYQLDFDDYTQISRHDTYQQLLGIVSYNITPESRLSVFGGTRFGRSSDTNINLDDTFYGAGLNVNLPLF